MYVVDALLVDKPEPPGLDGDLAHGCPKGIAQRN